MKIMVCGSMTFARKMLETKKQLEAAGHTVFVTADVEHHAADPTFIDDLARNLQHAIENDVLQAAFTLIKQSDAVLVLNYPKNGIGGYIGTSTLMEMAVAHSTGKKILLLNPIPDPEEARWAVEVEILQPVILNGDLTKIV